MQQPWFEQLAVARRDRGITQTALARQAGLSSAAITSYELGRRSPTREQLLRLLDVLNVDQRASNDLLVAAGFAPRSSLGRTAFGRYLTLDEAAATIQTRPWPALVMNEKVEMLAANDALLAIWGFDARRLEHPVERNVLTMVTDPGIASRALNWDDAVSWLIAVFKAHKQEADSLDRPSPYLTAVLDRVYAGDARLVSRFIDLWESAPSNYPNRVSLAYPVRWHVPGAGTMRFECLANSVNEIESLDIDDWIPVDAASQRVLHRVLSLASPAPS